MDAPAFPLHSGTAEQFSELRHFLRQSAFDDSSVCARAGIQRLDQFLTLDREAIIQHSIGDALDLLIRLFLIGPAVDRAVVERWLPPVFHDLGFLAGTGDQVHSTVTLHPILGLFIASDRWSNPDQSHFSGFDDFVYPALTTNTRLVLEAIPNTACERFLDLGAGTGIVGLLSAQAGSKHVFSCDIGARAMRFVAFNRDLNGFPNIEMGTGDLFEPAGAQTFDRIVAHPPYMPTLKPAPIFSDGGQFGESVTKRIVAGLPRHLRPGGRLYAMTAGAELEGQPFEERVRGWLGAGHEEFDVTVLQRKIFDTRDIAMQAVIRKHGGGQEMAEWNELFIREKVRHFVYCTIVIQRHLDARPPFTMRRPMGPRSTSAEIEWALAWESNAASVDLMSRRLLVSPSAALHTIHRWKEGELRPESYGLRTQYPFEMEIEIQPGMTLLLEQCDGTRTAEELFEWCKANEVLSADTPAGGFQTFLKSLISGGFLQLR